MNDEKSSNKPDAISSLFQSALGQLDEIKDALVRGSQAGKAKIDAQLWKRQRERLLVQLAEALLLDVERGNAALPAGGEDLARQVKELDAQIESAESEAKKVFP